MSTAVRSYTPPEPESEIKLPDPEPNTQGADVSAEDLEPIEEREGRTGDMLLEAMGIEEEVDALPQEDRDNLKEVKQYILDVIKKSGISPTMGAFKETLNDIKAEFGLHHDAEPSVILDRIGGVVKAWKGLSFVKDPKEKRSLFMKLARQESSKDMNKLVLDEMERHQVWL
jgi:hypothetical protein